MCISIIVHCKYIKRKEEEKKRREKKEKKQDRAGK
jgi:hypothetical protein